jgi:hypothetical protein
MCKNRHVSSGKLCIFGIFGCLFYNFKVLIIRGGFFQKGGVFDVCCIKVGQECREGVQEYG